MFAKARLKFGEEADLVELLKNIRGILSFQQITGRNLNLSASHASYEQLRPILGSDDEVEQKLAQKFPDDSTMVQR